MIFTDTHTHLADSSLYQQLPHVLQQAREVSVSRFIVPSADSRDWPRVLSIISPDIHAALGIHPWYAMQTQLIDLQQLATLIENNPRALVGEIGLDYLHRSDEATSRTAQQQLFTQQLELATQYRRPVIIHNVRASADTTTLLKRHRGLKGIVHAFSGSLEEAQLFTRLGLKIGIGSLLLNPNAKKVQTAALELPLSSIVLETDSPFMLKNKINTPANIFKIAETLCQIRKISLTELSEQTEANVNQLLNFQAA